MCWFWKSPCTTDHVSMRTLRRNAQFIFATRNAMLAAINPGGYMPIRRKAILCLCDDSSMLQVRRMLLERVGYTVLPSSSVEDVKSMVLNECPDMLLMDNSHP